MCAPLLSPLFLLSTLTYSVYLSRLRSCSLMIRPLASAVSLIQLDLEFHRFFPDFVMAPCTPHLFPSVFLLFAPVFLSPFLAFTDASTFSSSSSPLHIDTFLSVWGFRLVTSVGDSSTCCIQLRLLHTFGPYHHLQKLFLCSATCSPLPLGIFCIINLPLPVFLLLPT
jgi:hypothetical protein